VFLLLHRFSTTLEELLCAHTDVSNLEGTESIPKSPTELNRLDLSHCLLLEIATLDAILALCGSITSLDLTASERLEADSLSVITKWAPQLRHLWIAKIPSKIPSEIA
jgi:hypothetical protein